MIQENKSGSRAPLSEHRKQWLSAVAPDSRNVPTGLSARSCCVRESLGTHQLRVFPSTFGSWAPWCLNGLPKRTHIAAARRDTSTIDRSTRQRRPSEGAGRTRSRDSWETVATFPLQNDPCNVGSEDQESDSVGANARTATNHSRNCRLSAAHTRRIIHPALQRRRTRSPRDSGRQESPLPASRHRPLSRRATRRDASRPTSMRTYHKSSAVSLARSALTSQRSIRGLTGPMRDNGIPER